MFFTENKLKARIEELSKYRYRECTVLKDFALLEDDGEIGAYPPTNIKSLETFNIGDRWSGRDRYIWLSKQLLIPASWEGKKVVGIFNFGRTGPGNTKGLESLLFLNRTPYQGVDSNHQEVFFPDDQTGQIVTLDIRLWSGLEGGGEPAEQHYEFKNAMLAWLDEEVDDLYFSALAALQTVKELSDERPEKHAITTALNNAFNYINWSYPGEKSFYEGCELARTHLLKQLQTIEKTHSVTVHCIGHTHIDVAWLWRLRHTREKTARSFSTALRLMEEFPDYIFLQTQPQLYEYLKKDYPEIYEEIKRKVKSGQWEPEGAMWLEADCNIPSGESLVRQILYGKQFLRDEFGVECNYLWLPDVFGYSWALPQILKKSGIETFMTTKISWNQFNRMPHDTFVWRGIDGSEILTHFITTPEPSLKDQSWFYTYNGVITAETINGSWKGYRDKKINQDILLAYGYGDGGGGVNREMLELRRRFERMPGLPHVKTSKAGDYFKQLHETINKTTEYVHTWDGELYLEYHRGTYTSQAYTKRMNRKLEILYREVEWLSVWEAILTDWENYQGQEIKKGWKILLRNQFHDIIPGTSIHEVYEDAKEEYAKTEQIGQQIKADSLVHLVQESSKTYSVFNSSNWVTGQLIYIPYDELNQQEGYWLDDQGNILESQRTPDGWVVMVQKLLSFGVTELEFSTSVQNHQFLEGVNYDTYRTVTPLEYGIETPFYKIDWDEAFQLTRLYDKTAQREVLKPREKGNVIQVFEDKPVQWDAWDIDVFYQEKEEQVTNLIESKLIDNGPLQAVIRTKWRYQNSLIEQDMIVYSHSRRIDFKTRIDWQERQKLVKVAFPVDVRATEATFDIQFGNVTRPTHWNTSWDMARFETVGHQWADISEGGYGVSLLNDCKYGYDIKDNVLRLSLLKSSIYPDPLADKGEHLFTYSLLPHEGDWRRGETVKQAWYVNQPLQAIKGKSNINPQSFLSFENNHVQIDSIKKKEDEDAVIVRLHEFEGKRGIVNMRFNKPILEWQETNLMEQGIVEKQIGPIHFTVKPYEIKTIAIYF